MNEKLKINEDPVAGEIARKYLGKDVLFLDARYEHVEGDDATIKEVDLIQRLTRMEPYDDVLDLCCGQGRISHELARRGFESVLGLDSSKALVRMARKKLSEEGLKGVRFSHGDAKSLRYTDGRFDSVVMWGGAFGQFDKVRDEEKVVSEMARVLRERGTLVIEVPDGEWLKAHFQPKAFGWNDQKLFVCVERGVSPDGKRLMIREVVIDPDSGEVAEHFAAERLFSKEEMRTLLVKHGLIEVYCYPFQRVGEAQMESRLIFTAAKGVRRTVFSLSGRLDRQEPFPVRVLLEDPKIYDPVAREMGKAKAAHEEIERFKEGLKEVTGFSFSYFDNHRHLVKEWQVKRPIFVLNECSEGFLNDGEQRLHLPALMDMIGVAYGGSGAEAVAQVSDVAALRLMAQELDILIPEQLWLGPTDEAIRVPMGFPVRMRCKGEKLIHTLKELSRGVNALGKEYPRQPILIEEALPGPRMAVGVCGNAAAALQAFPVLEQVDGMWIPCRMKWEEMRTAVRASFALFRHLRARDWGLFFFQKDQRGNLRFVDATLTPPLMPGGILAKMGEVGKLSYPQFLEKLLLIALERNYERIAAISGL